MNIQGTKESVSVEGINEGMQRLMERLISKKLFKIRESHPGKKIYWISVYQGAKTTYCAYAGNCSVSSGVFKMLPRIEKLLDEHFKRTMDYERANPSVFVKKGEVNPKKPQCDFTVEGEIINCEYANKSGIFMWYFTLVVK